MSNVVVLEKNNPPAWWEDNQKLDIVKKTISSKPLTDMQLAYFLELAKVHELNPFLKQITAIPQGEKVTAFVTIDGLFAIANRTGRLDGLESGHRDEKGDTVGWCRVYVKGFSHPVYTEVLLSEFKKPGANGRKSNWDTMPKYMIKKVAEAHAFRRAFPENIGGLYSEEEKWDDEPVNITPKNQKHGPGEENKQSEKRSPIDEAKKYTDKAEEKKKEKSSGMKGVKAVSNMSMSEIEDEIQKAIAFIILDDIETKILESQCIGNDMILKALREMAKLKKAGDQYLPSQYYNINKLEFEHNNVVDDDVPY